MDPKATRSWLIRIIRQRRLLLQAGLSKKNPMLCESICERLSRYLSANPYSGDKIYRFIARHYSDILIIIPGNDALEFNLKILNQCAQKSKTLSTSTAAPLPTQLLLALP